MAWAELLRGGVNINKSKSGMLDRLRQKGLTHASGQQFN